MNPKNVASARTARLVREASTPTYSTSTPAPKKREHLMAVEWDSVYGRSWNVNIPESELNEFINSYANETYEVSDIDHYAQCWCMKERG